MDSTIFSVSDSDMKVIDPMAAIPEGQVLESQATLGPYATSYTPTAPYPSPLMSPMKHRRVQNILHGLRTPLGASKISIDGVKPSESFESRLTLAQQHPNLAAPLHGVGIAKSSYFEDITASAAGSHCNTQRSSAPREVPSPSVANSAAQSFVEEGSIFVMEMDHMKPPAADESRDVGLMASVVVSGGEDRSQQPDVSTQLEVVPEIVVIPAKVDVGPGASGDEAVEGFENRGRHISGSSKASSCGSIPNYDQATAAVPRLSRFNSEKDGQV